jgi:hypothetical protein
MRTHVEFRSPKFQPYPDEEGEVNPGLWGKRLAEYLLQNLRERGIETGEIYSEDWGWVVPLRHDAFSMWVGCGHYQEYEDGYLVFIEPSKPLVRKGLFKKIDTTKDVARVAEAIEAILTSDQDIQNLRWWAEDER